MIETVAAFVFKNWKLIAVAAAAVTIVTGVAIWRGKIYRAGEAAVTGAVEKKTIETIEKARTEKETIDETIRKAPVDDVIDRTR